MLFDGFIVEWFYGVVVGCSGLIKLVLMDSYLVVGIGNIYVLESFFCVGILLLWVVNWISWVCYVLFVIVICEILFDVIVVGGSSICDYVYSDGGVGCF